MSATELAGRIAYPALQGDMDLLADLVTARARGKILVLTFPTLEGRLKVAQEIFQWQARTLDQIEQATISMIEKDQAHTAAATSLAREEVRKVRELTQEAHKDGKSLAENAERLISEYPKLSSFRYRYGRAYEDAIDSARGHDVFTGGEVRGKQVD